MEKGWAVPDHCDGARGFGTTCPPLEGRQKGRYFDTTQLYPRIFSFSTPTVLSIAIRVYFPG